MNGALWGKSGWGGCPPLEPGAELALPFMSYQWRCYRRRNRVAILGPAVHSAGPPSPGYIEEFSEYL